MFLYHKWLELPFETRNLVATQFGIVKRGPTEVFNNTIKSDGYVIKEIEEMLNVDTLQKFLESEETDMMVLWSKMVDKVEGREDISITVTAMADPADFKETVASTGDTNPEPKKKAGRPNKTA